VKLLSDRGACIVDKNGDIEVFERSEGLFYLVVGLDLGKVADYYC